MTHHKTGLTKGHRRIQLHAADAFITTHHYEFTQPEFTISNILIEHDESGKGKLSFMKKGYDELVSDPIQVSSKTLERINER